MPGFWVFTRSCVRFCTPYSESYETTVSNALPLYYLVTAVFRSDMLRLTINHPNNVTSFNHCAENFQWNILTKP